MKGTAREPRRIVVVGGGIAGIATAWGLAREGAREVVLLEREEQLAAHSTAKNASILRTFTEHAGSTRLALETAAFLADPPPGFSGVPLVDPVGLVLIPSRLDTPAHAFWRSNKAPGTVVELATEEVRALAPHYRGATRNAFLVRDEGHIDNAALIEGLLREARATGVRVRTGCEVVGFPTEGSRLAGVELAGGERLDADVVVLASGAWAAPLAERAGSGLRFEPRRRHLLVTAADGSVDPRWPILWAEEESFYARPESGGLMVCVCDQDVVDPDRCAALEAVRERIAERAGECLVGFEDARAAHFWAGMRTFSEDDDFAIGFDPGVPGLFWVAGLGGHGMSTSVGVGRLAARRLLGREEDPGLRGAFDPARFGTPAR